MSFDKFITDLQRNCFEDVETYPSVKDMQMFGWATKEFEHNFVEALTYLGKPKNVFIIEVGTFLGLSANIMAQTCKSLDIKSKIVCVDTWLGSPEHMEGDECSMYLTRTNGIPSWYNTFLKNTKTLKNDNIIYPFPIASMQGAYYMQQHKVQADIIYIDAGHEYESVLMDLALYWNVLRPGGVMICDDWLWPGVNKAIKTFVDNNNDNVKFVENVTQVFLLKK